MTFNGASKAGTVRRAEWTLALGVALFGVVVGPSRAGDFRVGGRTQSALVRDDNVLEASLSDSTQTDAALRLLGEGWLIAEALPLESRAQLSFRGLAESFQDHSAEDRRQGEASLWWDLASVTARRRLTLEAGYGLRAYAGSPTRGHHRAWGQITGTAPVGPRGSLVGRLDVWQLDFRRTARTDRTGGGFDLSYEHPCRRRLVLRAGLELGAVGHGVESLRLDRSTDPQDLVIGADRRDRSRFVHLGFRRNGRLVVQAQAGLRIQASNSVDGVFRRPEVSWLVSRPLAWRVSVQCYGNLSRTTYTESVLRRVLITRTGEIEAGDDDNTVVLRCARPVGYGWDLDARVGWYRNEALLVGVYYRKQVVSVGISRNFGSPSGF